MRVRIDGPVTVRLSADGSEVWVNASANGVVIRQAYSRAAFDMMVAQHFDAISEGMEPAKLVADFTGS